MTQSIQRRDFSVAVLSICSLSQAAQAQAVAARESGSLEMGLLPNISARVLMSQYQSLREYLARALQQQVQLSTASDWIEFYRRLARLEYDLVATAPHMARLAQLDHRWQPMLQVQPDIRGVLVFAASRPIAAVAELRGRALVMSNPQSLVALRGLRWLADNGLQPDRDFRIVHTSTDDSVGNLVLRGDAVAAMLSAGELHAIPESTRRQLHTLTVFAEVPGLVIAAGPQVGAARLRQLRSHLLAFVAPGSREGAAFLAATGFTGMRDIPSGLMESMDVYVDRTRGMMARAS